MLLLSIKHNCFLYFSMTIICVCYAVCYAMSPENACCNGATIKKLLVI